MQILLVAVAGALGALARWGISALMPRLLPPTFPFGTLAANLAGCFILGVLTELAEQTHLISGEMRKYTKSDSCRKQWVRPAIGAARCNRDY